MMTLTHYRSASVLSAAPAPRVALHEVTFLHQNCLEVEHPEIRYRVQSSFLRMQRFFENHLICVMLVFIG